MFVWIIIASLPIGHIGSFETTGDHIFATKEKCEQFIQRGTHVDDNKQIVFFDPHASYKCISKEVEK